MDIRVTNQRLNYRDFRHISPIFVETGSGHGDGIQRALDAGFEVVYSIEAQRENFDICARRFANDNRVRLFYGRSEETLPRVLSQCEGEQLVIFLDAHVSGEKTAGYKEWKAGNLDFFQDTIIKKELRAIMADGRRHTIIMDDINGIVDGFAEEYQKQVVARHPDYEFQFYDEEIGKFYKDKLMVATPRELL